MESSFHSPKDTPFDIRMTHAWKTVRMGKSSHPPKENLAYAIDSCLPEKDLMQSERLQKGGDDGP